MAQHDSLWRCAVCLCEFEESLNAVNDDQVCSPCVRAFFARSIINEESFPPIWGMTVLDPMNYRDILEADFLETFEHRQQEWTCPLAERIYCHNQNTPGENEECGHFVGQLVTTTPLYALCHQCLSYTCLKCSETIGVNEVVLSTSVAQHRCKEKPQEQERDEAFQGLVRGRDYQDCPNERCRRRVELGGGCNHITCRCWTDFCYICGSKIADSDIPNHWRRGGCPRYGYLASAPPSLLRPSEVIAQDRRHANQARPSRRQNPPARPMLIRSRSRLLTPWDDQRADQPVSSSLPNVLPSRAPRRGWANRFLFRRTNSEHSRDRTPSRDTQR